MGQSSGCQPRRRPPVSVTVSIRRTIALLTLSLSTAVPAVAQAQSTQARPGNAGIDEYQEAIPGSKGSSPAGGTGVAPKLTTGANRVIPKRTLNALASKGDDGKAAAALAEATSPKRGSKQDAASQSARPPDAADGSSLDAIGRVLAPEPGDGGLGLALPIGMVLVLIAAIGAVMLRRRSAA